jgi:hypothetical protein
MKVSDIAIRYGRLPVKQPLEQMARCTRRVQSTATYNALVRR